MDIFEIRRLNLIHLIETRCNGVDADFAKAIERDPSYVSRCKYPEGKKWKKRISDKLIQIINDKFELPIGWMDTLDHESQNQIDSVQNDESDKDSVMQYDKIKDFQKYVDKLSTQKEIDQVHELLSHFVVLPEQYKQEVLAILNRIYQLETGLKQVARQYGRKPNWSNNNETKQNKNS